MTTLGHAEAHERLSDLALERGTLDRLGSPATDPLAAHVAACAICALEVGAWRRTHERLEAARGSGHDQVDLAELAMDDPINVPAELRGVILAAARGGPGIGRPPAAEVADASRPVTAAPRRPRIGVRRFLPLAAVLAVVAVSSGVIVDQAVRLDRGRQEAAALEAVAATMDRVLRDPEHRVVELRGADGTASGSVSWSRRDIAVLALSLEPPPPDRVYRCWIERGGVRSPVGEMLFAGATAYWTGSLDEWATISFAAGTFGVSLEPVSGPRGNPAVLVADLGS